MKEKLHQWVTIGHASAVATDNGSPDNLVWSWSSKVNPSISSFDNLDQISLSYGGLLNCQDFSIPIKHMVMDNCGNAATVDTAVNFVVTNKPEIVTPPSNLVLQYSGKDVLRQF